ncbi:hypothetical protein BHG07_09580 [Brenneria salicis ATCC 15712 = DSM 30166]|nr:hypothetical protein BHG07_09580 [Brenneria salicis ATCC 15712 = DSM 30166]
MICLRGVWVGAQRCAATLAVAETGVARCKGGRAGGGITRPARNGGTTWRKAGDTGPDERQRSLAPRGGSAPSQTRQA